MLVVLAVQTLVGVAETWFVSFLGTAALTAAALVFPAYMGIPVRRAASFTPKPLRRRAQSDKLRPRCEIGPRRS